MFNEKAIERIFNLLDWDAQSYQYSRATLDSKPYQIVKDDKKSTIILNAVGIKKDDIKILVDRQHGQDYLTINGDTKNELLNKTYSVSGRFVIDSDCINNIEWDTIDGLLIVEVFFKECEKNKIDIKKK